MTAAAPIGRGQSVAARMAAGAGGTWRREAAA